MAAAVSWFMARRQAAASSWHCTQPPTTQCAACEAFTYHSRLSLAWHNMVWVNSAMLHTRPERCIMAGGDAECWHPCSARCKCDCNGHIYHVVLCNLSYAALLQKLPPTMHLDTPQDDVHGCRWLPAEMQAAAAATRIYVCCMNFMLRQSACLAASCRSGSISAVATRSGVPAAGVGMHAVGPFQASRCDISFDLSGMSPLVS